MPVDLYFKKYGEHGTPVLVLHGLFGSGDNWATLAKKWASNYQVYTLDLRNHGLSPHALPHTYAEMADDVAFFIEKHLNQKPIIMGHSMGGKVAMELALGGMTLIQRLIVVDIAPRGYVSHHQAELAAMHAVSLPNISSRQDAEKVLQIYLSNPAVIQFIMKGLYRDDKGRFHWRFNLSGLTDNIEEIGSETRKGVSNVPTLFIKGEKSDFYIQDGDYPEIKSRFPKANIVTIPNAGHWVQAEQPIAFDAAIQNFLNQAT